ncbi:MAG: hypothetical protein UT55_C0041G0004 [Candidatus Peregrinibacteria bacterium GW2011_GWE2_39_6]|nr:MAG: hypothetical protein UT36_C0007G0004 [Candidatus Peregrinibacteria bacterium GW2011_GWF2_39_17]KKR25510.1 MAG: hypothetical protein UT55_C0041G0004 [Candidatus Peregrinibacteria bacterium GW2011_GWE2_39_6]HCW31928.1 hypothetical protein [Candidatus Peregrinibacteria bacterium]
MSLGQFDQFKIQDPAGRDTQSTRALDARLLAAAPVAQSRPKGKVTPIADILRDTAGSLYNAGGVLTVGGYQPRIGELIS